MDWHYPAMWSGGFRPVAGRSSGDLRLLDLSLLTLKDGEQWSQTFLDAEAALVILGGSCDARSGAQNWQGIGARANVFAGKATTVYVPAGGDLAIAARGDLEAALITAQASNSREPKAPSAVEGAMLIRPEDVAERVAGAGNWRRSVQDIIDARVPAQRLLVGETYNEPGAWSSYPPHKHDTDIPGAEVELEEVYHFRIDPPQGFGFQRVYSPQVGLDEAYVVKNGDTVVIPRGYHPVAAAPGYRVYYLWALAGEKRIMKPNDDPAHAWVHELQG